MDPATDIPSTESWQSTQELSADELNRIRAETLRATDDQTSVKEYWSLDSLKVEDDLRKDGLRTLIRLLDQIHSIEFDKDDDSHSWLNLQHESSLDDASDTDSASDSGPDCKVLGVKQTTRDTNFRIRILGERGEIRLCFSLYYDPVSDYQFIKNDYEWPFTVVRLSPQNPELAMQRAAHSEIVPRAHSQVQPGSWRILVDSRPIVDFRILSKLQTVRYGHKYPETPQKEQSQKRENTAVVASASSSVPRFSSSDKRTFDDFKDGALIAIDNNKKPRLEKDAIGISRPVQDPVTFMLNSSATPPQQDLVAYKNNPLSNIPLNTVVHVGHPQKDEYMLMRRDKVIHNSKISNVFKADYTRKPEFILVKILKTGEQGDPEHPSYGRSVISQADSWMREFKIQSRLKHKSIVSLIGGDARFLALYMEPVDAEDLSRTPKWRDRRTGMFSGNDADAHHIFSGIISALQHIHSEGLVHNDIKPSNILYSETTGVMLCDFGMASETSSKPNGGGTPWYVPIEFMNEGRRGAAGDVWAFGVVMLYVLKKMPMPGYLPSHFPEWQIHLVNSLQRSGAESPAATSMRDWIAYVRRMTESLDAKNPLETMVSLMLKDNHQQRPASDKLAKIWEKRVGSWQNSRSNQAAPTATRQMTGTRS